jgi:hypothetical protein
MALITIFTTFQPVEAQLVRSSPEAAGLHPEVVHELSALSTEGYSMTTGGVRVAVPEEEVADAQSLLETARNKPL